VERAEDIGYLIGKKASGEQITENRLSGAARVAPLCFWGDVVMEPR
jgi:hypothetical protein